MSSVTKPFASCDGLTGSGACTVVRPNSPGKVGDTTQPARQKYRCEGCHRYFDDRTGTVLTGRHQPLRVWILCLYFMGLNLSNAQIAQELGLNPDDVQRMTEQLRDGVVARQPEPTLAGEVKCDEGYLVAGHQGSPKAVKKRPPGAAATAEGRAWARHLGEGPPRSSG